MDGSARGWLSHVETKLNLRALILQAETRIDDVEGYDKLVCAVKVGGDLEGLGLDDFAAEGRMAGRVVVTTLHSSKGRQFDAVILSGLQETLLPTRPWNKRSKKYEEPSPVVLAEERRLFYVGFTRARRFVFLVYSDVFKNPWGYEVREGPSRFIREIQERLAQEK